MKKYTGNYKKLSAGILLVGLLCCSIAFAQPASENPSAESTATENTMTETKATETNALNANVPEASAAENNQPVTPATAVQKSVTPGSQVPRISSGASLLNLAFGLGLILILIFALAWLARRMGQGGMLNNSHIKVMAAMPLGTRERLLVVDVGGQQLLLGITATQINTLHVFTEPVIDKNQAMGHSEFGKKLMAILQQKTSTETASMQSTSASTSPAESEKEPR